MNALFLRCLALFLAVFSSVLTVVRAQTSDPAAVVAAAKPLADAPSSVLSVDQNRYPKRRVGQVCVYREKDPINNIDRLWTETITEATDSRTVIRVETERGFHDRWYDANGNRTALFTLGNRTRQDHPPAEYYRWPLAVGKVWEITYSFPITNEGYSGVKKVDLTARIEGIETVQVAGKSVSAYRITYSGFYTDLWATGKSPTGMPGTGSVSETVWLAPELPCPKVRYAKRDTGYYGSVVRNFTKELLSASHTAD